jgi:hypothetical protein
LFLLGGTWNGAGIGEIRNITNVQDDGPRSLSDSSPDC